MIKRFIDIRLLKYLVIFYTISRLTSILRKFYIRYSGDNFVDFSWTDLFSYNIVLDWFVVIFFMTIMSYFTKRMFERGMNWKLIISIHLFFSIFIGWFIYFCSVMFLALIDKLIIDGSLNSTLAPRHLLFVIEQNFLVYFAMIGIISVYYYLKKVKNIELQKSQLQTHLANSKLNALKAQLNPHFIFNTLNSISSLIEDEKEKSQNLIADFGDLLRDVLDNKDQNKIPLHKELDLLKKYIDIISVRFSDHLKINIDVKEGLDNALIPYMILQPLLENSIEHGYSYENTELVVNIVIFKEKGFLHFKIDNNGEPLTLSFKELLKKGTGLSNSNDRLKTLYLDNYKFEMTNKKNGQGVKLILCIPFEIKTPINHIEILSSEVAK